MYIACLGVVQSTKLNPKQQMINDLEMFINYHGKTYEAKHRHCNRLHKSSITLHGIWCIYIQRKIMKHKNYLIEAMG